MSLLDNIISAPRMLPPRVLLYGPHKIGKTTFAASAHKPIVIQTEEGADTMSVPRFPLARTYADIQNAIATLYHETHDYATVVIDSIDWLEPLVYPFICERDRKKDVEDYGYGKGYGFAAEVWRTDILPGLDALRSKGMAVILLGHCEIKRFDNPETSSYDRYLPKVHRLVGEIVQEWCDANLFANYKTFTVEHDVGFNKDRTRAVGTGERIINTQERPAFLAGNRYSLPPELPMNWGAFINAVMANAKPAA